MIVVDVAHHQEVDRKRRISVEPARFLDFFEARLEMWFVDVGGPPSINPRPGSFFGALVKKEAVAFARTSYV